MVHPGLAGQLGDLHDIASVDQRTHRAPPAGDLAVELGGVHRHGFPVRDAVGKDGDLIPRLGRHAQGLQVAAAGAVPGVQAPEHHAAAGLSRQQLRRQVQVVLQRRGVQAVGPLLLV